MSETSQRTTYLPGVGKVLLLFGRLKPKLPSPKSQLYASTSPFGSVAVAVKSTVSPAAIVNALALSDNTGGTCSGNGPMFTTTSIHLSLGSGPPPWAIGVRKNWISGSAKVRPIVTAESFLPALVSPVVSTRMLSEKPAPSQLS